MSRFIIRVYFISESCFLLAANRKNNTAKNIYSGKMFLFIISRGRFYFLFATVMVELFLSAHRPRFIVLAEPPPDFLESILSVNSGSQIIVSNGCIISFIYFCRRNMAQPFQQSSIVIPAPPPR
ncbi:hypothetical protein EC960497_A0077 [Escherichia coli 96.0497]|nr:hypothetical protein EC960497_A0077 [Escherichia coli 96.0497]